MSENLLKALADSVIDVLPCPHEDPKKIERWRKVKHSRLCIKIQAAIWSFEKSCENTKHDDSLELVAEHFKETWYVKWINMSDEENTRAYHVYADAAKYYDSMVDNQFIKYCSLLKVH